MEAIIVFDKNEGHKGTTYNLNILQKLVPILFQCEVFHPYYVYDNVDTLFNNTSMLPFKIITSDFVLAVSYEQDKAVLCNSQDMVALTGDTFQKASVLPILSATPSILRRRNICNLPSSAMRK